MDTLIVALGPAFACGVAVQHVLELADPLVTVLLRGLLKTEDAALKRVVVMLTALGVAALLVGLAGLRVLGPLGLAGADAVDVLVTVILVSAGTEGFNSVQKFLGHAKANTKTDAESKRVGAGAPAAAPPPDGYAEPRSLTAAA